MHTKNFEQLIRFYEARPDPNGPSIWLPLVNVTLITPDNRRRDLSLFFDTGASITTLRADLYPLLGLQRWDQGQRVEAGTGNGIVIVYQYTATLEIFGKVITCPIFLNDRLPDNDYYVGLLGRDTIFNAFGFGFWERTHELYVTGNP